ncbi:hypothetical protein Glove_495g45 [Diversispora epigaea]|uniref:Uncharacterized protein n=1 Tax=Diversispora epigaea TaxID=1348612 RepID=A0A397GJ77_9GLOM|nr:hypothetical protein Glove_495g45 [Diversispora epigaea]
MSPLLESNAKLNVLVKRELTVIEQKLEGRKATVVKWYKPVKDYKTRFYFQIEENDSKSCNIEL